MPSPLTKKQRALVDEIDQIFSRLELDYFRILAYEGKARTVRLELARRYAIRGEVITQHTLIDERLSSVLCDYFFGRRRSYITLWRTTKFKNFNHYVLQELSLVKKLAFVEHLPTFPGTPLRLYIMLLLQARFRGPEQGTVAVTFGDLARGLKLSYRQIERAADWLRKEGYVTYTSAKNQFDQTVFTVLRYKTAADFAPDKNVGSDVRSDVRSAARNGLPDSELRTAKNEEQCYKKGKKSSPPSSPPKGGRARGSKRKRLSDDRWNMETAGFQRFWEMYPKQEARVSALRVWNQLKVDADPGLLAQILAGLGRWNCSGRWAEEGGRYVPLPENFLRKRRWEDKVQEYLTPAKERTRRNMEAIRSALESVGVQPAFGEGTETMTTP
jgi:DNA-binding transcriptional ArsR family regulator